MLAHLVATGWLMALVVRDVLRPEHDPVRSPAPGSVLTPDPPAPPAPAPPAPAPPAPDSPAPDSPAPDSPAPEHRRGAHRASSAYDEDTWPGVDDPAGGVLDHAPDAVRLVPVR